MDDRHGVDPTSQAVRPSPAPPPTTASLRRPACARGTAGRFPAAGPAATGRRRGVDPQHERPRVGVADHRDRRRVDDDPLELVEVHAEGVGQHRLDHVAVARPPPRPRRRRARPRPAALRLPDGVHRAGLHRRAATHRRGTSPRWRGPARPSTAAPWPASLSGWPGPLAVPALAPALVDDRCGRACRAVRPSAAAGHGGDGRGGLPAALERAGDDRGERHGGEPRRDRAACSLPALVEVHARGPAGQGAGDVRGGAAVPDEDQGWHAATQATGCHPGRVIVDQAVYRQRRARMPCADLSGRARPPCARGAGHGWIWVGLKDPTDAEFDLVKDELQLHPLAVEDAVNGHQRPKLERLRRHRCSSSSSRLVRRRDERHRDRRDHDVRRRPVRRHGAPRRGRARWPPYGS